jgi:hypothetical protein
VAYPEAAASKKPRSSGRRGPQAAADVRLCNTRHENGVPQIPLLGAGRARIHTLVVLAASVKKVLATVQVNCAFQDIDSFDVACIYLTATR